jgi:hypothetical protein
MMCIYGYGNDLSRQSAEKTATDLVSFANFLNELAPVVIVGQLLFRNPVKVGELYNNKVVECNKLIETSIKDNPNYQNAHLSTDVVGM